MRVKTITALLCLPALAVAQEQELNAEFFQPNPGYGFFGVLDARLLSAGKFQIGAFLNIADDPVLVVDAENREVLNRVVDTQSALDLTMALGLFHFMEVGAAIPVALLQDGDGQAGLGGSSPISGGVLGDIRLSAKLRLKGDPREEEGFFLSLIPSLTLPTGDGTSFFGSAGSSSSFQLAAAWRGERFSFSVNGGPRFQRDVQLANLNLGNTIDVGVGTAYKVTDTLSLLGDANGSLPLNDTFSAGQAPAEARLGVRLRAAPGLWIPVGAGFGLTNGLGAPDFRILAGLTFSPEANDPDKDGILGKKDLCPDTPEDLDQFKDEDGCPEDNDEDGVADAEDACPNDAGPADLQGCPDQDGDKIVDKNDSCPAIAEDLNGIEDNDGCPDDKDGDLVADKNDLCPDTPGLPDLAGCPDQDGDKIADKDDACPDQPGLPALQGCPDQDDDKIADHKDSCPQDPEDFDKFEDEDGCPDDDNDQDKFADKDDLCPNDPEDYKGKQEGCPESIKATVTGGSIAILDVVYFDTGKDTLQKRSFAILDAVVQVLQEHPEIVKLQIEGHTDDVGKDSFNKDLSERRARRVMEYLISKGIAAERLTAVGFGEENPLESIEGKKGKELNAAREKNRRVVFTILEKSE